MVTESSLTIAAIIPTHNREKLVYRALQSIIAQTHPVDEIIVVDDASDNPIERYLKERIDDKRLKVIRNEKNMGGSASRNRGAKETNCDLIAMLDSDDYWLPQKIEKQLEAILNNPNIDMVFSDQFVRYGDTEIRSYSTPTQGSLWDQLLDGWTAPNTTNLLIRRRVFEDIGGFDDQLSSCQDHDFWMQFGYDKHQAAFVAEPLSVMTDDASNRITQNFHQRLPGIQTFLAKWKPYIIEFRGEQGYQAFANEYYMKTMYRFFRATIKHRNIKDAWYLYRQGFIRNPLFYRRLLAFLSNRISRKPQVDNI